MPDFGADIQAKAGAMNRRALAKEIGISPTTLIRLFQGHVPDMKTCRKVCAWLGVDINEYLQLPSPDPDARQARINQILHEAILIASRRWEKSGIKSVGHQ